MNLRVFLFAAILAGAGYLAYQQPIVTQQLRYYNSSTWMRSFKRFVTLDSLELPDREVPQEHETDALNPLSLGWVKRLVRDFPELSWYANDRVKTTFEGSYQQPDFCWSKALYGKIYPEFDRAVLSVWCLRAFYNGSQSAWRYLIAQQPPGDMLSWNSFQDIHHELIRLVENHPWLNKEQALLTMETYLILADSAKTPYAQLKAREWELESTDTKRFFQKTLEVCPQIYPSLMMLPYPCVELIRRTSFVVHMGHLRHLEGQPTTLRKLIEGKLLQQYPIDFEFFYMVDLCDSAAFLGQLSCDGSLFLTESMYQANLQLKQACESTLVLDEHDAYMRYLQKRAISMGLDIHSRQDRVLTRIGGMLRLNGPQYGPMLRRSFSKLNVFLQALILSQLDVRDHDPLKRTPNYIPAVLTNLLENEKLGNQFQERLDKTFVLGLPFIATVLKDHRVALSMRLYDSVYPLNFNPVAKRVADNPYILNHVRFQITPHNVIKIE